MGDFKGHVGDDKEGIDGNREDINENGRSLRDFMKRNRWTMKNADKNRTTGLFTRSSGGFSTILDYVITDSIADT